MKTRFSVFFLLFSSFFASAQTTHGTLVWQGITRHYTVVVRSNVTTSPELIITLHGTKHALPTASPDVNHFFGWDYTCKQKGNGCILVSAASTWDSDNTSPGDTTGYWMWNAQFFDGLVFSTPPGPPYPDDSGFLRRLITNIQAQYHTNPKKVHVVGFSAGAFMAARVAVDLSDIVAAVSINSGSLQSTLGSSIVPNTLIRYPSLNTTERSTPPVLILAQRRGSGTSLSPRSLPSMTRSTSS